MTGVPNGGKKILKVGIVGAGGAGLAHYRHFHSIRDCRVAAFYDPHPSGQDRARRLSGDLIVTDQFERLLDAPVDIVSICSPDRTHAEYIIKSLRAGKHVLCEKPLADSLDDCRAILRAQREAKGCVMAVQHQMRFLPVHLKMKEIIQKGTLGKISYLEGYYVHNLTERAGLYDRWRFQDKATPLVYSGCHFVDLFRWLLDEEAVEVFSWANNRAFPEYPESDLNVTLLRFKSGILAKVITAFGAGCPQDHSVRIYGSERMIENNLLFSKDGSPEIFHRPFLQNTFLARNMSLQDRMRAFQMNLKPVLLSRAMEGLMGLWNDTNSPYAVQNYPMRVHEHSYAMNSSVTDFVDAIRRGGRPQCAFVDAAQTVATCLAGVESFRTGQPVPTQRYWLPEFGRRDEEK